LRRFWQEQVMGEAADGSVPARAAEAAKKGRMAGELVLFHAAHSTCSQKVRLCLAEKGLAYESRVLEIRRNEHLSAEYLAINPNGVVPTLTHDGAPVVDSSVICEYLDEVFPTPPLSPRTPLARAGMRTWLRYLEEVPTTAIRVPSINAIFLPVIRDLGEVWEDVKRRAPLRRHFYERIGEQGFDQREVQHSMEQLGDTFRRVDRALQTQPCLAGDDLSLADLVLLPTVVRLEDLGLSSMWADLGAVGDWYARITSRPAFERAFFPGSRLGRADAERVF
jgi:glutathione S-transferase